MPAVLRLVLLLGLAAARTLSAADAGAVVAETGLTLISPGRTVVLSAADVAALPHTDCAIVDPHGGQMLHFSGVAVCDLLACVDAPLGAGLRGGALQLAVIVRARDGYSIVFALAEFDAAFNSRVILLADREDGKPLAAASAPFRLVVPGDKRPARWARMVTSLEIVRVGPAVPVKP